MGGGYNVRMWNVEERGERGAGKGGREERGNRGRSRGDDEKGRT